MGFTPIDDSEIVQNGGGNIGFTPISEDDILPTNQPQSLTTGDASSFVLKNMAQEGANFLDFSKNAIPTIAGSSAQPSYMQDAVKEEVAKKYAAGEITIEEAKQALDAAKPTTLSSLLTSVMGSPSDLGNGQVVQSTPATRIIGAAAQNALIPGGQVANTLAGVGGQAGHELAPDSIIAPIVGTIAGAGTASIGEDLMSLLGKVIGPQSEASAARTAAQTLSKLSGNTAEDLNYELAGNVGPLASSKTSAELLQSPQLATIEQAMGTIKPNEMAASAGERATTADNVLSSITQDSTALKENTGTTILDAFNQAKQKSKDSVEELVKPLYGAAYDNMPFVKDPALSELLKKDQVVQSAIKAVQRTSNNADLPVNSAQLLVKARSEIGNKIEQAISKGSGREARDLTDTYNRLNEILHVNPLLKSADETYAEAIGEHNNIFSSGPLSKLSSAQGSQVIGNILSSPEAAAKASEVLGENPTAIQAIKDQIGTDMLNMTDAQRIRYVDTKESQLKSLLPKRDYEIVNAIRNDARLRIDTAKSGNPTGGSNTALKSLSLPSIIGRSIKSKESAPSGVWGQLVSAAMKGGGTLAGGFATYSHPLAAIPIIGAAATVKGLRDRSAGLVQDALFNQLKNPEKFLSALQSMSAPQQSIIATTIKSLSASNPQALPALLNAVVAKNGGSTTPALRTALSTVLNKQGAKMDIPEPPKILASDRIAKAEDLQGKPVKSVIDEIKKDPVDHAIMMMESSGNPKAKNKDSTAAGLFQLTKSTAKKLGVTDVFDPAENYKGYLKLKEENSRFGTDPQMVYAAHYLGATTLSKWLNGKSLTEEEQAQVRELKTVLLPKLMKIYNGLVSV